MREVEIDELQQHASAVIARATAGEMVTITDDGRPVACLVAPPSSRLAGLIVAGLARPARHRLSELGPPPLRRPNERVLSSVLETMRTDVRP
jgi:prevent-host-death family protein